MRMRLIVICGLSSSTIYFSPYLINGRIFDKKNLFNIIGLCVFFFSVQILSETFLIKKKTERDMIKDARCSSCKVPAMWSKTQLCMSN